MVVSDSCPSASAMTESAILFFFAIVAHECRHTYVVRGMLIFAILPIFFKLLFILCKAASYCFLSSPNGYIRGRRYSESSFAYS